MTRDEALKILAIEADIEEEVDPKEVMERFDFLFEKNQTEKGGSFYIQSKIYFAKQHLMSDFSADLNVSQWNPENAGQEEEKKEDVEEAEVVGDSKKDDAKAASDDDNKRSDKSPDAAETPSDSDSTAGKSDAKASDWEKAFDDADDKYKGKDTKENQKKE